MGYEWDFSIVFRDFDLLLLGLVNTLKVTGIALAIGIPLGLILALARLYGVWIVRAPVGLLIEFLRTTPPIAQLFWFFFALPLLIDVTSEWSRSTLRSSLSRFSPPRSSPKSSVVASSPSSRASGRPPRRSE